MAFRTYFSHSYRSNDRSINKHFWRLFAEQGYFFSVDPKSKDISVSYLESLMRGSQCFVSVVTYRAETPALLCSPFIMFEYGMAVQAKKPGLVFIDKRINVSRFPACSDIVVERFDANGYGDKEYTARIESHIADLTKRLSGYGDPDLSRSNKVGLLLNTRDVDTYSDEIRERIKGSVEHYGYSNHIEDVRLDCRHPHEYALQLDDFELIIVDIDVRRRFSWLFPYIYGRFIPTIKLYRLEEGETPSDAHIPQLLKGIQSDSQHESVVFWRHEDDLIKQIHYHMARLKSDRIEFRSRQGGDRYFDSIGRRPASVFISNAATANPVAAKLIKKFRAQNIQYFHYTEDDAIRTGDNWRNALQNQVSQSEIVVALIDEDFAKSKWCMMELDLARECDGLTILPYVLTDQVPEFLEYTQARLLHNGDVTRIVNDVDKRLREPAREIVDATLPQDERMKITFAIEDYLTTKDQRVAAIKSLLVHAKLWDQLKTAAFSENARDAATGLVILVESLGVVRDGTFPRLAALRLVETLQNHYLPSTWCTQLSGIKEYLTSLESRIP